MKTFGTVAAVIAALALSACTDAGTATNPELEALADRVAIEDMVVEYYAHLGGGDASAFERYFTADAVFDVNGRVANGRTEIEALYGSIGENPTSASNGGGPFRMILSNPVIKVDGERATAQFIWTGIRNPSIDQPPVFAEQGREYDQLVKVDGKWLFAHRVVIADSGLPAGQYPDYSPRLDFSFDLSD